MMDAQGQGPDPTLVAKAARLSRTADAFLYGIEHGKITGDFFSPAELSAMADTLAREASDLVAWTGYLEGKASKIR